MATRKHNLRVTTSPKRGSAQTHTRNPELFDTWPIVWRVVAPAAGSFGHDMVFADTNDEHEARKQYRALRSARWPVRLERVLCGPLPNGAKETLTKLRRANRQNPGQPALPKIPGAWEAPTERNERGAR